MNPIAGFQSPMRVTVPEMSELTRMEIHIPVAPEPSMNPTTSAEWHEYASGLALQTRILIDGKWILASDGGSLATINPATGEEITAIACLPANDLTKASGPACRSAAASRS